MKFTLIKLFVHSFINAIKNTKTNNTLEKRKTQ